MLNANSSDSSLKRTQIKQRKDLGLLPAFRSEPIAYSENVLYTAQLLTIVRLARRLLIVERREEDPTLLNNTVVGKAWLGQSYSTQSANPCIWRKPHTAQMMCHMIVAICLSTFSRRGCSRVEAAPLCPIAAADNSARTGERVLVPLCQGPRVQASQTRTQRAARPCSRPPSRNASRDDSPGEAVEHRL
jgi:hypothetical protein